MYICIYIVEKVNEFKYLGSQIESKSIRVRWKLAYQEHQKRSKDCTKEYGREDM